MGSASGVSANKKPVSRKAVARSFAKKWVGCGYEKDDALSFWLEHLDARTDLCQVVVSHSQGRVRSVMLVLIPSVHMKEI